MIPGRLFILIDIVFCLLVPPGIIIYFLKKRRKVLLPSFLGIVTFGANWGVNKLLDKFVFSKANFLLSLKLSFFGDVIFFPLLDAAILMLATFFILERAKCDLSSRKVAAFALGYGWINNTFLYGQNLADLIVDWFRTGSQIYKPDAVTLFVEWIVIIITVLMYGGVVYAIQTGINSRNYLKYVGIAAGMMIGYNMMIPLTSNWMKIPFAIVMILRVIAACGIAYGGYRLFKSERHVHRVVRRKKEFATNEDWAKAKRKEQEHDTVHED